MPPRCRGLLLLGSTRCDPQCLARRRIGKDASLTYSANQNKPSQLDSKESILKIIDYLLSERGRWIASGIPPLPPVLRALQDQLADTARLLSLRDPNGVYAYCFCETR